MKRCLGHCCLPDAGFPFILVNFVLIPVCPEQKVIFGRRKKAPTVPKALIYKVLGNLHILGLIKD